MVSNIYLHFFRQNKLCFQAIPGIGLQISLPPSKKNPQYLITTFYSVNQSSWSSRLILLRQTEKNPILPQTYIPRYSSDWRGMISPFVEAKKPHCGGRISPGGDSYLGHRGGLGTFISRFLRTAHRATRWRSLIQSKRIGERDRTRVVGHVRANAT